MTTTEKEIKKNEFEQIDSQTKNETTNQDQSTTTRGCTLRHQEPAKIELVHYKDYTELKVTDVNFGEHLITTTPRERFKIKNIGDDPVTIKVTSSQAPFVIRALERELKRKNDSESIDVQFEPTADGIQAGEVRVAGGDGPDQVINLTGTGTRGRVKLEPETKDFGEVEIKMSSPHHTFKITNDGTGPLRIDDIVPDRNAKITRKDSLFSAIEKEKSVTFDVVYTPQDADAKAAVIQIKCKAPAESKTLSVTGQPLNLARPKFKVLHGTDGVEDLEVKLFQGETEKHSLGPTSWSGVAELKQNDKGFAPEEEYEIRVAHNRRLYALAEPVKKKFTAGSTDAIDIKVIKVARPRIEVVWKGNKVPGAKVTLSRDGKNYVFDVFDNRNQRYSLKDDAEGLIGGEEPYSVTVDYGKDFKKESKPLKIDPGSDALRSIELVPRPRPSIQLTWKSGGGVKDVVVELKGDKEYKFADPTNDQGMTKWSGEDDVAPGVYKCQFTFAREAKYPIVNSDGEVVAEPSVTIRDGILEYPLYVGKPARPKIEVVWKGNKVQGAGVKLIKDSDEYAFDKAGGAGIYEVQESAAGLAKGTYQVKLDYKPEDFKPVSEPPTVKAEWGDTGKTTISLVPLLRPQIKLTWKHGGAIQNAALELKGAKSYKFTTPTNDHGVAKWSGEGEVDPGDYTCEVTFADGVKHTVEKPAITVDKDHLEFALTVLQTSWIKFCVKDVEKPKVTIKWPTDDSLKSFETEKIDVPAPRGPQTHCELESVELPKDSSGAAEAYEFLDIETT